MGKLQDFFYKAEKKINDFTYKTEAVTVTAGAYLLHPALGSSAASYYSAKEQRKQAKKDQANQFVRMRNAAQRAGFNPLTPPLLVRPHTYADQKY